MACRFTELVIDCADPAALADFWAAVLGGQTRQDQYGYVQVSAGYGPLLTFVRVPERNSLKNRLHIDLNPVPCSQADEVTRILRLGAKRIDIGQGTTPWVVMADPEGNEFCVLQPGVEA